MTTVDAHLHVIGSDATRYPFRPLVGGPPKLFGPVEDLLQYADAIGVDRFVAVQSQAYGYDHSYMRDAMHRFPGRILGVCIVPPRKPDGPQDLERLVREDGFRGLRLNPAAQEDGAWLLDEATFPLWRKAIELRVPIGILMRPHHAAAVEALATRFPDASIVIDHFGNPDVAEGVDSASYQGILRLARCPNVSIKISRFNHVSKTPFPHPDLVPFVHRTIDAFGPDRCMWGTDFPNILSHGTYAESHAFITQAIAHLTPQDRAAVLGGTALRIWWGE